MVASNVSFIFIDETTKSVCFKHNSPARGDVEKIVFSCSDKLIEFYSHLSDLKTIPVAPFQSRVIYVKEKAESRTFVLWHVSPIDIMCGAHSCLSQLIHAMNTFSILQLRADSHVCFPIHGTHWECIEYISLSSLECHACIPSWRSISSAKLRRMKATKEREKSGDRMKWETRAPWITSAKLKSNKASYSNKWHQIY